jgi:hypothetical protein
LNARTFEIVFRALWSSVSATWIRLDAQRLKSGADIRFHAFPVIRRELCMRLTAAGAVGERTGLRHRLLSLVLRRLAQAVAAVGRS